jgi:hypothetical protein
MDDAEDFIILPAAASFASVSAVFHTTSAMHIIESVTA